MARRKSQPVVLTGRPATLEDIQRVFKLSNKTVARLTALVESTPGVRDSSEAVIRRHKQKALTAGS